MRNDPQFMMKLGLIIGFVTIAVTIVCLLPSIPQDPSYHVFADQHVIFGINNFWNIVSNLAFLLVGVFGLFIVAQNPPGSIHALRNPYRAFFAGIILVAFGSALYHLNPSSDSLVWDRLPMAISFMAFFAIIIGENISVNAGNRLLWPVILLGMLSVLYWYFSELQGMGDLRAYALVQFLPMLLIPLILLIFRSCFSSNLWIWLTLCAYVASKATEMGDMAIYASIGFGGHALKHLFAALGAGFFLIALQLRKPSREQR